MKNKMPNINTPHIQWTVCGSPAMPVMADSKSITFSLLSNGRSYSVKLPMEDHRIGWQLDRATATAFNL